MYTLIIENRQGRSAAEISFDQGSYTIGRVDGNDVVLPSNSVSRTHARIFVANSRCYIDDLGSANGVHVNGKQIHERTEISNGSKIRIGEYTLYLEYKDKSESSGTQDVLKTQIVSQGQTGYKIVRICDKFAGEEFMLADASISIGRTEDNYILLSDQSISRNHAIITFFNNVVTVKDLGSSNGTFVNGKRISVDTPIQPRDQVRFGNVSFVFIPSSQRIDPRAYRKKRSDKRTLILILGGFAFIIALLIVIAIAVARVKSDDKPDASASLGMSQEEAIAKLNEQLDNADKLYQEKHFEAAKSVITPLKKNWPNDSRLMDLDRKIEFEISMEVYILDGSSLVDSKNYHEGIDLFKKVDPSSVNYGTAQKLIQDTERKIRLIQYNDARSLCDAGMSDECITELCEATMQLGNSQTEVERANETIQILERVARNKKSKYASSAKKCLSDLR